MENIKHKYFLVLAIIVYTITAINSHGHHHFDEHFQILEFAGLKLDFTSEKDLAWEYNERIRPAIQPVTAEILIRLSSFLGMNNPFQQIVFIRIITALFMLFVIFFFVESVINSLSRKYRILFLFLSYFLFYLNYLSVRFSSETLSAGFFILGLSIVMRIIDSVERKHLLSWVLVGLILGLSFCFRFQSAFMLLGLFLWIFFIKKTSWKELVYLCSGILITIGIGVLFDYYFYGEWEFTSWNYFRVNILQDKASYFGVSPWYFYIKKIFDLGPLSYITGTLFALFVIHIIREPLGFITFIVLPFLLVHFYVGHKELRFIFPILYLVPFAVVKGWGYVDLMIKYARIKQIILLFFGILFLGNGIVLFVNSVKPADGQPLVYKYLEKNFQGKKVYYLEEKYPFFNCQAGLQMNFYGPNVKELQLVERDEVKNLNEGSIILVNDYTAVDDLNLIKVHQILPDWLRKLNRKNWMRIKNAHWIIYQKT